MILIGALFALVFAIAGGGSVAAVSGGAIVAIIVGLRSSACWWTPSPGSSSLLRATHAVGDVVRPEPSGYTGTVESIGLRATVLNGSGSERMIVPNGSISGIRVIPAAAGACASRCSRADPETVEAMVHEIGGAVAGAGGPGTGRRAWSCGRRRAA